MKIIQSIKEKMNNSMEALEERYLDAKNVVVSYQSKNTKDTGPQVYSADTVMKHYLHSLEEEPMIAKGAKAPQDPQRFPVWIDTNDK